MSWHHMPVFLTPFRISSSSKVDQLLSISSHRQSRMIAMDRQNTFVCHSIILSWHEQFVCPPVCHYHFFIFSLQYIWNVKKQQRVLNGFNGVSRVSSIFQESSRVACFNKVLRLFLKSFNPISNTPFILCVPKQGQNLPLNWFCLPWSFLQWLETKFCLLILLFLLELRYIFWKSKRVWTSFRRF